MTLPLLAALAIPVDVPPPTGDLRVMAWNVQRAANAFENGPEKTLRWIRAAKPDIVLMQESYDIDGDRGLLGAWIAEQLEWNQYQGESTHLCVLTPHPMEKTFFHAMWHGVGARIATPKGTVTAFSIWLDSGAYMPYYLRDNPSATNAELLRQETDESSRLKQVTDLLDYLKTNAASENALIVGGDFNCPSHLDWSEDAARIFRVRRNLPLPVSQAMVGAGFADSFREVHPNVVQVPGITWSPLYRGTVEKPETGDRIDRIYRQAADTLRPVAAHTLPLQWENNAIPEAKREFPSDHGAVIIDFVWKD